MDNNKINALCIFMDNKNTLLKTMYLMAHIWFEVTAPVFFSLPNAGPVICGIYKGTAPIKALRQFPVTRWTPGFYGQTWPGFVDTARHLRCSNQLPGFLNFIGFFLHRDGVSGVVDPFGQGLAARVRNFITFKRRSPSMWGYPIVGCFLMANPKIHDSGVAPF